ncbi:MAG: hypothetical protein HQL23_02195 [Candidatus Omnitrophica bacterium]|nr:hypothetical protein [Candidatus Omnitrophota bacterium]
MQNNPKPSSVKAIGLLSGGLDSILAARVIKDMGIAARLVYFILPWLSINQPRIQDLAAHLGLPVDLIPLDEQYLEMVKDPHHGYGTAINPCIDCKIHMLQRAGEIMRRTGSHFVFTGEVLGQRPMSQNRQSLDRIEKASGLFGRLVRPLSGQLLPPTIPETEGLIDRAKLLSLSGRSRKDQLRLATEKGITNFSQPAGGCLLTDKNFAKRLSDLFQHGGVSPQATAILQHGRHFRLDEHTKLILGRDEQENDTLIALALPDDVIIQFTDERGPTAILQSTEPSLKQIAVTGGFIQHFSKSRDLPPRTVKYTPKHNPLSICSCLIIKIDAETLSAYKIA